MLVITAASALIQVDNAGEGTMGSPDPPKTTGFDSPVTGKTGVRPLLTVLLEYSDLPADVDASYIENQVFGPRPSMNDYFIETSYGNFQFSNAGHFAWVEAWDDPVTVDDESTWAYWDTAPDPTYRSGMARAHALKSLDEAGFDFAPLDADVDGTINTDTELGCQVVFSRPPGDRGAANRGMPPQTLDGKNIVGSCSGVSEDSPWVTLYAHELGHQTLWLPDYYGIKPQNIGMFTLMGYSGTGGWAGPIGPHHLDPYSKLKLGWYTPSVVMTDGFYDIPDAETNPVSFILHDPAHGTDEYYMIENRWMGSSYDDTDALIPAMTPPLPSAHAAVDIPDEGILIWHVDETRDWNGSATGGFPKVNLTRRINDDNKAAFNGDDPDYYDFYDGSAPRSAKWNDGTNSKTGVWCVSDAGPNMRAWLDVPGPGILVCSVTDSTSAIPGLAGTISVKLTNTGDAMDTFSVSVVYPGSDLAVTLPGDVTLGAKSSTTVDIDITPVRDCTTSPGIRSFKVRAQSTTDPAIWTEVDAEIDVLSFSEPVVTLPIGYMEVDPADFANYTVQVLNDGNDFDTFSFVFTSDDFGTTYEAFPTSIPIAWVTFIPTDPSAPACGLTSATLSIAVPWDWAAMEDALYTFHVTASGTHTSDTGTTTGQLLVHATPLSMMFWVKAEIEQLLADVDALPPSDVRDGLHDKGASALAKIEQAIDRYLLGDDPPASNLFRTTQNKLEAFIHQLHAQRGKALTETQADDFEEQVLEILAHIDDILAEI